MPHRQRMGEVDLGVNKNECYGKHDQNRGTDLENKRGGRSRQLLSPHGHDGLLNGSSKQIKTRRTSPPQELTGSAPCLQRPRLSLIAPMRSNPIFVGGNERRSLTVQP